MSVVQTDVYVRGSGYFNMNYLDFSAKNIMKILFSIMWMKATRDFSEWHSYYWNVGNRTLCLWAIASKEMQSNVVIMTLVHMTPRL